MPHQFWLLQVGFEGNRVSSTAKQTRKLLDKSNQTNRLKRADNAFNQRILCVDLDGTLIRSDMIIECIVTLLRSPKSILNIFKWLSKGRAYFKYELARNTNIDISTLPYNSEVIGLIKREKKLGTKVVLVTAASEVIAEKIAAHLDLFDEVIASTPDINLKGEVKARAMLEHYGNRKFSYIGDSRSDLAVWKVAYTAFTVGISNNLKSKILRDTPIEESFDPPKQSIKLYLKQIRAYQWVKNLLVFVPLLTSGLLTTHTFGMAALVFFGMSLVASSIYIINDIFDICDDRKHPDKRERPIASGAIGVIKGAIMSLLLLSSGLFLSFMAGALIPVCIYALLSIVYSVGIKTFPIADVFMLAGLYTIRIVAGGVATGIGVSLWLFAFSGFVFLALAIVKRVAEFHTISNQGDSDKVRGYHISDQSMLTNIGVASTFASGVVLSLYLESTDVNLIYNRPEILWGLVPLMIFWQCRLWLVVGRGRMHSDPIIYATRDWVSYCVGFALLALIVMAHYI